MCCIAGGPSEEEEEIGGGAGGGEGRFVGDGHSSGHCAHLQYSKGSTALYPGESEVYTTLWTSWLVYSILLQMGI